MGNFGAYVPELPVVLSFAKNGGHLCMSEKTNVKLIFDTDLGGDCDDTGACAVLCNLAKAGEVQLLCATYCIGNPWGGYFLRYELDYFGFSDVPVGVLWDDTFMTDAVYEKYSRPYVERMGASTEKQEDAVRLLRKTLAANGGNRDIVLCAVGPLRNIANLLKSPADDISPLDGISLVRENVSVFYTMLGYFESAEYTEWNLKMDIPSARYCVENMPVKTVFLPSEAGSHIVTGQLLQNVSDEHPVRAAYTLWNNGTCHVRSSWDLITAYCAVRQDTPLYTYRPVHVTIDENGISHPGEGDDMAILTQNAPDEEIVNALNPLML